MNKWFATSALAFAVIAAAQSPTFAQDDARAGSWMGMMGGSCPTIGMMGQGMMGQGMMGQGMMGQGMMGQGMMGQGMMGARQVRMGAIIEARLAYLKTELKIGDPQVEAWNGYADASKARVIVMQGMHETMLDAMQKGSAVERLDVRIKGMEAMLEAMKTVKPATEKLYAVLSAEQKKIADQLIGVDCGAM